MTSKLTREHATDTEIQMLIDSHEKGTAMFMRTDAYYFMAKELQERRKADSEPVAFIDKQWTLVYYVPPMNMGLQIGDKLYRHAQPAPELKPVGYLFVSDQGAVTYSPTNWGVPGFRLIGQIYGDMNVELQPTPVAPDDLLSMAASAIEDLLEHTDPNTSYYSGVWADVPGKLRAAMLQTGNCRENANSSTNNCREIAETSTSSPVIGIDPASGPDCSVEVRYVAPPGYVMVPKEPTSEMVKKMRYHVGSYDRNIKDGYKAMLAAAPHDWSSHYIPVNRGDVVEYPAKREVK